MKKEGKEMTGGTSSSSSILPNSSVAMSSSGTGGERASPSLSVLDPSTLISTNVNAKDSADKLHAPSSSSSSSKKSKPPKAELPSWIFDLEEYDDIEEDGSRTLFEELEIDPTHIYK